MSALDRIDRTKPLTFSAWAAELTDEPEFLRLAESLNLPQMKLIDVMLPGAIVTIEGSAAAELMNWLSVSKWGEVFEADLQCLSQDKDGNQILSSCISLSQYGDSLAECEAKHMFNISLDAAFAEWSARGAARVFFEGYEIPESLAVGIQSWLQD